MVKLNVLCPLVTVVAALGAQTLCRAEEPGKECTATGAEIAALMVKTKVNAVTNYAGADSDYRPDDDPETLELVLMPKTNGAINHVSSDGEVIFLHGDVKDKEEQQLISLAFCLRAVARRGLTTRTSGP